MGIKENMSHEDIVRLAMDIHDKEVERMKDEMERMEFRKDAKKCLFNDILKACKSKSEYPILDRYAIYNFLCDSFQLTQVEKAYLRSLLYII